MHLQGTEEFGHSGFMTWVTHHQAVIKPPRPTSGLKRGLTRLDVSQLQAPWVVLVIPEVSC